MIIIVGLFLAIFSLVTAIVSFFVTRHTYNEIKRRS